MSFKDKARAISETLHNKLIYSISSFDIRRKYTVDISKPEIASSYSDAVRCFNAALHNIADINTVPCVYSVYNSTGLLEYPFMLRAGRNYNTPWTRDAAINTWQAMRFLNTDVARTTLLAVCSVNKKGEPVIQPDVQTWDQIVWAIGAWNYYLATEDCEFLKIAYGVIGRALKVHRKNRFNTQYGLFRGGSFFNDGISGYPAECHTPGLNSSFAPDHSVVESIMCFSTNCLYCEAYRIYGEMASLLGDEDEKEKARVLQNELRSAINLKFWCEEKKRYRYILFPDGSYDDSQEASGIAFAVLFDICAPERQKTLLESSVISERGTVSLWPPFEGLYSHDKPGRHNNLIWPFINGLIMQAAAKCGLHTMLGEELERITTLFKNSNFELYEIYSPYTGKISGGWQVGHLWDSCRDQTWSATCYFGAIIQGVFGISPQKEGVSFSPCVPENLKNIALRGIKIQGMEFTIKIKGFGSNIEHFILDGKECTPFVIRDNRDHIVEIIMN